MLRQLQLPEGWTEAQPGGLATNPDPIRGGIIDQAIVLGEWFIVFHRDDLPVLDGFATRAEAFDALRVAISRPEMHQ